MTPSPGFTVVLIAGNSRERTRRALQSILRQDTDKQLRVLVYDRAYEPVRDLPEFDFPNVTYEPVARESTLGQLQKRAVLTVDTEIIAFIEEHAVVPSEWARESLHAHAMGYTGVSGSFIPGNANHHWARIGFLMTYGDYMFSPKSGETKDIPADNSSFIRSKLARLETDLEMLFNTDTLLTRRLVDEGEKLYRAGNVRIKHSNESSLFGGWTSLFYWNQMYVCNLVVTQRWSPVYRALRFLATPLVPLIRTLKAFKHAIGNSADVKQLLIDMPSIFVLNLGVAAGIATGLLCGYQKSEWRFSDCETSAIRLD
jgi:hypothetical protein